MKSLFGLKNKFVKEKPVVGLDIGTQAIKLVRLKFIQDTVELCGFEFESNQLALGEILKKFKQSQEVDALNLGFCGPQTVIRYVSFPRMDREELNKALKFEAQKHIPFSLQEVNIDACILKEDLPDNKMLVLLAAAKKDIINQRIKLIEEAGLRVDTVNLDSLAIVNAFNFNYVEEGNQKAKAVALLNIGSSISSLDILEGQMPRLSRDIHIGGNNFTQKIADIFTIDFKSAEELKLNPDSERANKISAAVESVLANLATEIRTSFDYYESQNASNVVKIFLSGGGSKFMNLKDMLANLLGIEVEYWDPFKKINLASNLDSEKLKAVASQLAVAVGLALRQ